MLFSETTTDLQQFRAVVHVSKALNAKAVGGMQLALKELATSLANASQLEEIGCWQKALNGLLGDEDF